MNRPTDSSPTAGEFDRDARRLLAAIERSAGNAESFAAQLESALAAVLTLFDSDPELARRLGYRPVAPHLFSPATHWNELFGARLRAAAERSPGLTLPPFFAEPHIIEGLFSLINRELRLADSPDLLALLPGMLEFLLRCYLDPGEVGSLIAARRAATGCSLESQE